MVFKVIFLSVCKSSWQMRGDEVIVKREMDIYYGAGGPFYHQPDWAFTSFYVIIGIIFHTDFLKYFSIQHGNLY